MKTRERSPGGGRPGTRHNSTGLANTEVEDDWVLTDKMTPRQFAELAGVDIELARLLYQAYGLNAEEYGAIFQNPDDYAVPLIDVFEFLLEQRDKGVVNLTGEQADKVDDLEEKLDIGLEQLRGEHWTRMVFVADVPTEGEETQALLSQIPHHRPEVLWRRCTFGGQLHQRPGSGQLLHSGQYEDQYPHRPVRHGHPAVYL